MVYRIYILGKKLKNNLYRSPTWVGNVGMITASDYAYATGSTSRDTARTMDYDRK